MATPSRRLLARYPCDIPVGIATLVTEAKVADGRFVNLSTGGALLDCARPLEKRVGYLFRFSWRKAVLELPGRVVWTAPRNPQSALFHQFGIQFNLTRAQEEPVRALVESLRRSAEPPAGRDILRNYWKR